MENVGHNADYSEEGQESSVISNKSNSLLLCLYIYIYIYKVFLSRSQPLCECIITCVYVRRSRQCVFDRERQGQS